MRKLGVFFGGRSVEHDVSIVTGIQVVQAADPAKYDVVPVYIARDGAWYTGEALKRLETYKAFDPNGRGVARVEFSAQPGAALIARQKGLFGSKFTEIRLDAAFLAMHGMNGEDGTLQGVLELADIPYTGPGPLGSAVGMDKLIAKAVLRDAGVPVLPGACVERESFEFDPLVAVDSLLERIACPVFVKPANLGSSIGIGRADDREALREALEVAFHYDRRALVEPALDSPLEINCAVLGLGENAIPSVCEQPVSWSEFLSFEEKYMQGAKAKGGQKSGGSGGMESMSRRIPAPIGDELTARIQRLALRAFAALDLRGVCRIDFMIDRNGDNAVYLNEANTLPGSMAFYLFEPMGIPFRELIDRLVDIADQAHSYKARNLYAFDSGLIDKVAKGSLDVAAIK